MRGAVKARVARLILWADTVSHHVPGERRWLCDLLDVTLGAPEHVVPRTWLSRLWERQRRVRKSDGPEPFAPGHQPPTGRPDGDRTA